jgi:hypothetical protein
MLIVMAQTLCAEDSESVPEYSNHSILKGSWSFQFAITDEFSLSSFKGSMVSAKKHLSEHSAMRFGISINAINQNHQYSYPSIYVLRSDRDYNSLGIKIALQYLYYKHSQSRVKPFIGIGPTISFIYDEYLTRDSENPMRIWQSYYKHTLIAGIQANWGIEWFISKSISLTAEYGAVIEFTNHFAESEGYSYFAAPEEYAIDKLSFHATPVNLGLSVYF